jgi:hemerythrin-like domain-containing protein
MDALTVVRQEHRRLDELLERLEHGGDVDKRAVLLEQLQDALRHHVDLEENILYPIFRERARRAEVDLAPLDQAIEQHRLIDRLARELGELQPDDDAAGAKSQVLAGQVRHHLDTEDSVLLTAIEDLIDDDTLLELGQRMEQRDRVLAAQRELAGTLVPGGGRLMAVLGGLAAAGAALLALLVRRRRPPANRKPADRRRTRRR